MDIGPSEDTKEVTPEKPKQVRIAIIILYSQLVFAAISTALNSYYNFRFSENFSPGYLLCWPVLVPAYLLLVFKSSKGKIWARNLLLIWFIYITFIFLYILYSSGGLVLPAPLAIYTILVGIIGLVANILLYIGPSKIWFEYHKQKKKS